jgi:hypothetical protein
MLSENISRPISLKNEDNCSDDETESDIQHSKWIKTGIELPHFTFIRKMGLKVEIQKPTRMFRDIYYPGEISEFVNRKNA